MQGSISVKHEVFCPAVVSVITIFTNPSIVKLLKNCIEHPACAMASKVEFFTVESLSKDTMFTSMFGRVLMLHYSCDGGSGAVHFRQAPSCSKTSRNVHSLKYLKRDIG